MRHPLGQIWLVASCIISELASAEQAADKVDAQPHGSFSTDIARKAEAAGVTVGFTNASDLQSADSVAQVSARRRSGRRRSSRRRRRSARRRSSRRRSSRRRRRRRRNAPTTTTTAPDESRRRRRRKSDPAPPGGSKCGWKPKDKSKGENPFLGETFYVNPSYQKLLDSSIKTAKGTVKETLVKMRNVPSAFWIDVKSKVRKGNGHSDLNTVEGILEDAAKCDPPHLVLFMVYDLPNRDCWALASNGEICCHYGDDKGRTKCEFDETGYYKEYPGDKCNKGLKEYQETYIDPFVEMVKRYQNKVPIVLVIEPDSLGNMVTNMRDSRKEKCRAGGENINCPRGCHDETKYAYMAGITYTVSEFAKTKASIYLDGAHGGWLGWANDNDDQTGKFAGLIKEMGIAPMLRGFATNVANYQPIGRKVCPKPGTCRGFLGKDDPCCEDDPCELQKDWNWGHNELNFIDVLHFKMTEKIPGFDPKFIIDSGRNGNALAAPRKSCGNWCNPRKNGIGHVPTTSTPDKRIDALYWLKTPGESDGCTSTKPNGEKCPRFDKMCESEDSIGGNPDEPRAPEAGLWFDYQIKQLAQYAQLGDPWWVKTYEKGLQCKAPDGGCAPKFPTPSTTTTTPEPGRCTGNDDRCPGQSSRKACYSASNNCRWRGCCGGSACAPKDHNGWMCKDLSDKSSCNANTNCQWEDGGSR